MFKNDVSHYIYSFFTYFTKNPLIQLYKIKRSDRKILKSESFVQIHYIYSFFTYFTEIPLIQ